MKMTDAWTHRPYKQQQEDFVSNHGGDLPHEVILVIIPIVTSILLASLILSHFDLFLYKNIRFLIQFVLIVVSSVLCCTLLSNQVVIISIFMFLMILLISFCKSNKIVANPPNSKQITIITNFRAATFLLTAICILAVDFPVFPRRFAKTENLGYSLMDTGVGLFIASNALVSPEARANQSFNKKSFIKNLKGSIPLIVIGICRALAIEYFNYQRHVSEYGVHWNFFITLAFTKLFSSFLVLERLGAKFSFIQGMWLLAMHEYGLSSKGYMERILGNLPRDNFIEANREGLFSLPGYIGLYLCCISIGKLVHSAYNSSNHKDNCKFEMFGRKLELSPTIKLLVQLCLISIMADSVTFICDRSFGVSRRLVNLGYAAWIISLYTKMISYFILGEVLINSLVFGKFHKNDKEKWRNTSHSLEMFEAINYNGLCFFLLANLLTGIINMSIKTLYVSSSYAVLILIGYIGIIVLTVLFLYRYGIQLRL